MGVSIKDLPGYLKVFNNVLPAQVISDTITSTSAIDTAECFEELFCVVNVGTITDGKYRVDILTDDSASGTFATTVASSSVFSPTDDEKVEVFKIVNFKRFIKIKVTETEAGTTGGPIAVTVLGIDKRI